MPFEAVEPKFKACSIGVWLLAMCMSAASILPSLGRADESMLRRTPCADAIYVARRGWHVDIGFGVKSLSPQLAPVARQFPGARYLFFGLGDRRYLTKSKSRVPDMVRALWPGEGIVLVTALSGNPNDAFGHAHVVELRVSDDQANSAQLRIRKSIQSSAAGVEGIHDLGEGPYKGSRYLATTERYSGAHTCNTWAAEVLHAANSRVSTRGVLFAGQVWRRALRLAATDDHELILNCRVASFRFDRPPWFPNPVARRPSFFRAAEDCCY